jgi:hypothetical protein
MYTFPSCHSKENIRFQSSFMLMTIQPFFPVSSI